MGIADILKRANRLGAATKRRRRDRRYLNTIGFLKAKGLLMAEDVQGKPNVKLDIDDVIWVAEKIEPRVYEVLPAAILHFPKTFFNMRALPGDLVEIIHAIQKKREIGKQFAGIEFRKMSQWANSPLRDKRVKPESEKRVSKNFRLKPETLKVLRDRAHEKKVTQTQWLEEIITRFS